MLKEFLLYVGFNDLNSLFGGPFTQSAFFHSKALFSIVFICKHVYGCVRISHMIFGVFALLWQDSYQIASNVGERGGWDWERSMSQDWNAGCMQRNSAICLRAAHEAIGADYRHVLKMWYQNILNFYTQCRSSMSRPKPQTNQMTPEAGQELQAFVDSIKLFYLTLRRHVKTRSV